jgi:hypothetical protein
MGDIPQELRATVKAQLLAFLLYSTLASLQQLAAAFGGTAEEEFGLEDGSAEAEILPGPHAPLRCLFRLDAGACSSPACLPASTRTFGSMLAVMWD